MTLLVKGIIVILFLGLIGALAAALPLTVDHPLDPVFTASVTIIFGYVYQWAQVFTAINYLTYAAISTIGLEVGIFLWRFAAWIIGFVARMIG